ncbi:unnamed protein product, partial [Meganyctiphanes norvegica]
QNTSGQNTSGGGSSFDSDPDKDKIPGLGGSDYPIFTNIPQTSFACNARMAQSNMMFADPETRCQVYHVCTANQKFSFLCPRGTVFHQDTRVCQWWYTVNCPAQAQQVAHLRSFGAS